MRLTTGAVLFGAALFGGCAGSKLPKGAPPTDTQKPAAQTGTNEEKKDDCGKPVYLPPAPHLDGSPGHVECDGNNCRWIPDKEPAKLCDPKPPDAPTKPQPITVVDLTTPFSIGLSALFLIALLVVLL